MKFNNIPNKLYQTKDGPIWNSRSVAVVGVILFKIEKDIFVLAQKRSNKMEAPGKWCVPSGYIDWNETGIECFYRETYEETGFLIKSFLKYKVFIDSEPFYVRTTPGENHQNVVLNYSAFFDFEDGHWSILDLEKFKNEEVVEVKLISLNEIDNYKWAFLHDERIFMATHHLIYSVMPVFQNPIADIIDTYDSSNPWHVLYKNNPKKI